MCEKCLEDNRRLTGSFQWMSDATTPPPPPPKRLIKEDIQIIRRKKAPVPPEWPEGVVVENEVEVNHDFLKGFLTATLIIIFLHVGLAYYLFV